MFEEFFRHRRRSQSDMGESWNQVRQTVSTIEAKFKFRQPARCIFRVERVITAAQGCLEIALNRIDPVKLRVFHGSTTVTADDSLMCTACLCETVSKHFRPSHLHQFVLHLPDCVVGTAQLSIQLHCRDALLGLRQQVNRLKPDRQWQFVGFKDGDDDDRRLAMAPIALAQFAGVEVIAFVMAAVGTDEAIRPAQIEQGF